MEARATFREVVTVSVFYVLVFALLVHPMAARFPSVITVDGPDAAFVGDGAMFVWNVDHFARAVHAGKNPFHANDILVPVGADLWLHSYVPIVGLIAVVVGSPIAALAIAIGASFVLSGLGAYLLARRFLAHPVLALLAGMVFAFCPYKLARLLGHYNLELTATLPFFALLLLDWHLENSPRERGVLASPGWRGLAGAGLLLLTLASDFYATYFCLWMVASTIGLRFLEVHPVRVSRKKLLLVTAVGLGASTGLVELYFALGGQAHGAFGYSADLVGYLLPSSSHRWLGGPGLLALKEKLRNGTIEHEVYAGITIVVLAGWLLASRALRTASPNERWLAFFTGTFLLLASPVIRVGGIRVLGLPHAVLNMLPGIGNLRVPARFSVVTMLGAAILAMLAVERLIFPRVGRVGRGVVASLLGGLLLFEYARKPLDVMSSDSVPPIYHTLAARPPGVVLELPFGVRDGYGSLGHERSSAMFFATVHRHPLIGGMIARLPQSTFDAYARDPLLGPLLEAQTSGKPPSLGPAATARIGALDLRYVVIRPEARALGETVEAAFADRVVERVVQGNWTLLVLR